MAIIPEDKDWTYVLEQGCAECGLDVSSIDPGEVAALALENAAAWETLFERSDLVTVRPADDRWSALEYACHVRDVYALAQVRLGRMLTEDDPLFANWDQDATAVEERYAEQDPDIVLAMLAAEAKGFAAAFDAVAGGQWDRPGRRSDGARFTVASIARYFIHDPVHHVYDVEQGYARIDASR